MRHIVLVAINAKYIHSNLAVHSLKAYGETQVKRDGTCRISVLEFTINQQEDEILGKIYRVRPDVVCFSSYVWNMEAVKNISRELAKLLPEGHLWLGGPEVSYDAPDQLKQLPFIYGIMTGEGEEAFAGLCREYAACGGEISKVDLSAIRGIVYRLGGQILQREAGLPMDMSQIPFPYEELDKFTNRILYYESSRGCPFSCSYCLSSIDKRVRFRSLQLVKEELQIFLDKKVRQVKFVDRTFNCKPEHSRSIWKYLIDHDNGVSNFHFEIAADLLREEDFQLFGQMRPGLIQLEIGVQTTNPETLKEIERVTDLALLEDVVKTIGERKNIHQHLDLIAGLPYEDFASFRASFNAVYSLHPDQLQVGFLKVLKGSAMHRRAGKYGLVFRDRAPYQVLYTNWLTYEEVEHLKGIEEMTEVYYNSGQFTYALSWMEGKFSSPFDLFDSLWSYYDRMGYLDRSHSRTDRYRILLEFVKEGLPGDEELFSEILTLDYYCRENSKSRPAWMREGVMDLKEQERICENLKGSILEDYKDYDKKQLRRMVHLESFSWDVTGSWEKQPVLLVFDYRNRDLNHSAKWHRIERV